MQLVEMKRNWVFCDSHLVARKFKLKHAYVVDNIKKVISDIGELRVGGADPKTEIEQRNYRGTNYTAYLMNRDFFAFLVMRFKGKRAIEWQLKFIAAFNTMESQLVLETKNKSDQDWLKGREQLKLGRREKTDVIKKFVDYCTAAGSENAIHYYKHVTGATYQALGMMVQKKPKLRNSMNIYEMAQLLLAEQVARKALKKYMDLGREYHDIYECVKEDLISFADSLRIE